MKDILKNIGIGILVIIVLALLGAFGIYALGCSYSAGSCGI